MDNTDDLFVQARAAAPSAPYAGAVTPRQAYALLSGPGPVKLVDVRTNAERDWVGRVAIDPSRHLAIEWNTWPGGAQNPRFLEQLEAQAGKDEVLLFLCRSGVRSKSAAAAATAAGYARCYDILDGFEGNKDAAGHRKTVAGWCKDGLPWVGA